MSSTPAEIIEVAHDLAYDLANAVGSCYAKFRLKQESCSSCLDIEFCKILDKKITEIKNFKHNVEEEQTE